MVKLTNFNIAKDNIALEAGGDYFDLHNCFDFVSLNYDVFAGGIVLRWKKSSGDWVPENHPENIQMMFDGVSFLKTRERDPNVPFSDDGCLSCIGFIWDELVDEMASFTSHEFKEGCTHLSLAFESGFAVKIGAERARIEIEFENFS